MLSQDQEARLEGCLMLVQAIERLASATKPLDGHWHAGRAERRDADTDAIEIIIEILRDVIKVLEPVEYVAFWK